MNGRKAKALRRQAAKKHPGGSRLVRDDNGTHRWQGMMAEYKRLKRKAKR